MLAAPPTTCYVDPAPYLSGGLEEMHMDESRNLDDLDEALRHCRAGLKALEAAHERGRSSGQIYPTHIYLATVELAHAIEVAMKLALRSQ
jgi:hypothetical protein